MKRFIFLALLFFVIGCTNRSPVFFQNVSQSETFEHVPAVSVLLPLSGESEDIGHSLQKAALLSLFEHKSTPIKLLFFDTKGSKDGAVEAYNWAIAQKSDMILGPVFSSETMAIKEEGIKKPLLTFSSDTTILTPDVASFAVLIPDQIQKLVQYACAQGHRKIAVLGPDSKTGEIAMNALDESIKMCPGMQLDKVSLYADDTMNFTPAVLKILPKIIKDNGHLTPEEKVLAETPMKERVSFDALFVFESGVKLRQLANLLNFYDVNPRQVPTYGFASANQVQDKSLNGIVFADVENVGYTAFAQKYKHYFGKQPVRLASLMYDALNLVFDRAETGSVSMESLRRTPYQGIDGFIKLDENGYNQRALQISQKSGKGTILLEAADMLSTYYHTNDSATAESVDLTATLPVASDESPDSFE